MNHISAAYEQLVERFVRWAQSEENVRAAVVIGSRARVDHPADEWSDLDVIILANDPEQYWSTVDWLNNVGTPWLTFVEPTPDGAGFERRVLFEGGLDVDFVPDPVAAFRQVLDTELPPDLVDMIQRGIRVLLDKDNLSERLAAVEIEPVVPPPPAEPEFLNVVNDFWYHTVWTAKHLRRGELWWAKSCCDSYLKQLLRQMLEWRARLPGAEHRYLDAGAVLGRVGRPAGGGCLAGDLCPLRGAGRVARAAGDDGAVSLAGSGNGRAVGLCIPVLRCRAGRATGAQALF
jgi:aminoglycoside 6-adenylyltransferase